MRGLVKRYGERVAVDGLSFEVERGTICALLGPNGAGKTTTVECLEGFRMPDAGEVRVLGLDPVADRTRLTPIMGVMLQEGGAYQTATAAELLTLHARFYAAPWDPADLLGRVGLRDVATTRFRLLSGGQKQRLNLALALVGRPEVVMLDEPTAGMDPHARQATWALVRQLRADGVTVLLTTHFMDEAERLADTVVVIDRGRLLARGTPTTLVHGDRSGPLLVTTPDVFDLAALSEAMKAKVEADGGSRYLVHAGPDAIPAVVAWFAQRGHLVTGVTAAGGGLEDVYLQLLDRTNGAAAPAAEQR